VVNVDQDLIGINMNNNNLKFNYLKYREYRKEHDNLSDEDLDNLDKLDHMSSFDKIDVKELIHAGYLVLDKWCS